MRATPEIRLELSSSTFLVATKRHLWSLCVSMFLGTAAPALAFAGDGAAPLQDVRLAMNGSPAEVEGVLGKPDEGLVTSQDCGDETVKSCITATYQSGRVSIEFDRARAKGFIVHQKGIFTGNALGLLGFPETPPTWANSYVRAWRVASRGKATGPLLTVPGVEEIALLPSHDHETDTLTFSINGNYNKRYK